jgi:hypothetical protein
LVLDICLYFFRSIYNVISHEIKKLTNRNDILTLRFLFFLSIRCLFFFFPHSFFFYSVLSFPTRQRSSFILVLSAMRCLRRCPCSAARVVLVHAAASSCRGWPSPAAVSRSRSRPPPSPCAPVAIRPPPRPHAPAAASNSCSRLPPPPCSRSRPSPPRSRASADARLPPPCTSVRASRGRLTVARATAEGKHGRRD